MPPDQLSTTHILAAYAQGYFLMADDHGELSWYSSRKPTLLPLDDRLHIPKSLRRALGNPCFLSRRNTAFSEVVLGCASRAQTWISPQLQRVYERLHRAGHAHSFEVWYREDPQAPPDSARLAGGVLGLAVGAAFIGESMFFRVPEASKVALVRLCQHLAARDFRLFDVQMNNPHLARFGAFEVSVGQYQRQLRLAVGQSREFM
jgi:leucyl/phenylalanyl-tRNA---protein transferase